tara:strand:+ start:381 stop:1181 length:801 start_codon:yes stop_codon:yes gene_type:complete
MPTKTGKTYASFYGNDLAINQSSNTGVDATTRTVHDGFGNSSAISLSDDVLSVQPTTDNTAGTFLVKNQGGSNILAVDTNSSKLLGGASQTALNTQYAHFGINHSGSAGFLADKHIAIPFFAAPGYLSSSLDDAILGTGTDPDTSLAMEYAYKFTNVIWYVQDNITIDAVNWFSGGDSTSTETIRAHLMSYTIDVSNGSNGGDLSAGVVLADGGDITNTGESIIFYQSMTVQSADVDAGKAIIFCFRDDTALQDYSISATVKYHIR